VSDDSEKPSVRPLKYFLRGIAFPAIVIGVCAALGVITSLLSKNYSLEHIERAAQTGAAVGFYISILGVGEIVGSFLVSSNRFMNGVYQSVGYALIWSATVFFLFPEFFS
jgi:hypothetical protein